MHDYGLITPENLQTWVSEQKFSGTFLLTPSTIQGVPKPRYWFGEFIIISKDTFNDFAIYLFTDAEFYCCVTSGGQWSNSWLQIHPNKYYTNPNLLDNWYFSDPVNQRNGYIIPKDTVIYSDSSLSESSKIGPAAYACTVVESASTYVKVWNTKLPDNYYYAAVSAAIPGYCGNWIYTIDRWNLADGDGLLEIHDGYITYKDSIYFFQPISKDTVKSLIGKTVTLSFLYSDGTLDTGSCNITSWSGNWNVFLEIGNIRVVGVDKGLLWVSCTANGKGMIAAKLELGDTQTLAHKENGVWVLNEIPDYGEQLARCQRHCVKLGSSTGYEIVGTGTGRTSSICGIVVPIPVTMRAIPVAILSGQLILRNRDDANIVCTSVTVDVNGAGAMYLACTANDVTVGASYDAYLAPGNYLYLGADL